MFFTVYKNHEIIASGDNFRIKTPNDEYLQEVAASVLTAKKWIDAIVIERYAKLDEKKKRAMMRDLETSATAF